MTEKLDAVMPKIALLLRVVLGNGATDSERINAINAVRQKLNGIDSDIHVLVERIEHGGDETLSASEMQKIYDAAYAKGHADGAEQGRRSVVLAGATPIDVFAISLDDGVNGYSWGDIAVHCAANKHLFHGKELDFIESMPGKIACYGSPTPPQAKWLRDIFLRKLGGRI